MIKHYKKYLIILIIVLIIGMLIYNKNQNRQKNIRCLEGINYQSWSNSYLKESLGFMPAKEFKTYDEVKEASVHGTLIQRIQAPSGQGMPARGRLPQEKIDLINLWVSKGFVNQ